MVTDLLNRAKIFQSTHPVRGATTTYEIRPMGAKISIHAPREGCDRFTTINQICSLFISIHAPREGCDATAPGIPRLGTYFNPRTP